MYGKLSTGKTLSYGIRGIFIITLESRDTALAWLRVMEEVADVRPVSGVKQKLL